MLILVGHFLHFHLLFNLCGGEVLSSPPPNWSPSETCPCPVSRLQVISSKIYKNHCQTKTWSTEGAETLSRERNKACLWNLHSPPFPGYTFPPALACAAREADRAKRRSFKGSRKYETSMSTLAIFVIFHVTKCCLFELPGEFSAVFSRLHPPSSRCSAALPALADILNTENAHPGPVLPGVQDLNLLFINLSWDPHRLDLILLPTCAERKQRILFTLNQSGEGRARRLSGWSRPVGWPTHTEAVMPWLNTATCT